MAEARHEVHVQSQTLSDGSIAYNVTMIDCDALLGVVIPATSENDAKEMAKAIHNAIIDHGSDLSTIHFDTGY
jgi:hypothetical protein